MMQFISGFIFGVQFNPKKYIFKFKEFCTRSGVGEGHVKG
jgi:hypothetical protein